ncbi:Tonsoku-Like Protein [Manis pentadactyla]|nr:Tonsoku-Like Protein [Manis pentadactyla]
MLYKMQSWMVDQENELTSFVIEPMRDPERTNCRTLGQAECQPLPSLLPNMDKSIHMGHKDLSGYLRLLKNCPVEEGADRENFCLKKGIALGSP